ncbi:unnamed protein product [Rotaria socialis]|uniref:F-box domain-containing protein n=2 Tax=Rotaria socialis TaxID=392032 RepID=A0A817SUA6_9BILA|nr:unnamed protein product [Rotaria socialis]CAF3390046.1 unnamed protein product [Rotaria socialis]CAF4369872.1 unnamed protein product [Rotaria socialis]CAF4734752.1 unnamed protein product [Rotaria socialis]
MEYSSIQLDDLPDEILLIIFNKLNKLSVLYSLAGVNKRLNVIAHSPNFTGRLNLLRCLSDHSIRLLPKRRLERFCSQMLPEIHPKIKWLNLESISIKRILLSATYPALYGLGLYVYCNDIGEAMSLITKLYVRVQDFTDCLYLLDGRFSQLRTFRVDVYRIFSISLRTNNKVRLLDLKSFSLHSDMRTHVSDELIMPLLRRMLNLET